MKVLAREVGQGLGRSFLGGVFFSLVCTSPPLLSHTEIT